MVLSRPAVPPFHLQGALSGPGVLPAPSLVSPSPMRSELDYFAWTLLPWDASRESRRTPVRHLRSGREAA